MSQPAACIVVPCYNEEFRLPVDKYRQWAKACPDYRFLLVDDGSTDGTYGLADCLRRENPAQFDVLKLDCNSGKAEAVRRGMLKALESRPAFAGYWDADLATPLETLPLFLDVFREREDIEIVMGSRVKLLGKDIQRRPLRHYLGRIFATMASFVLRIAVYDTQCGAKIFRCTPDMIRLFEEPFESRWIFDVELLARYKKLRQGGQLPAEQRIFELPLPVWRDVAGSKVKPGDFFKAAAELTKIHRTYR